MTKMSTGVSPPALLWAVAWRPSILGLSKGELGLHSLYQHAPTAGFGLPTNLRLCSAVADFNSVVPPDKALSNSLLSAQK